jgi:hypothetical protein
VALESTLRLHNDGAAFRVSETIESCFHAQSKFLQADLLNIGIMCEVHGALMLRAVTIEHSMDSNPMWFVQNNHLTNSRAVGRVREQVRLVVCD